MSESLAGRHDAFFLHGGQMLQLPLEAVEFFPDFHLPAESLFQSVLPVTLYPRAHFLQFAARLVQRLLSLDSSGVRSGHLTIQRLLFPDDSLETLAQGRAAFIDIRRGL